MIPKKFIDRTAVFPSQSFGLRPFMLYRIQVGRINRKVLKHMPGCSYSFLNVRTFMERSVVHDDHVVFRKFRQQILSDPRTENIRIDAAVKKTQCQQPVSVQRADSIRAASGPPVVYPGAPFTDRRVTVGSRHIVSETAFIDINQREARVLMRTDFIRENTALFYIRLRMRKSFFYG
jgi:hypothetical protein